MLMGTIRVEHLARIEGHGGITVELDGNELRKVQFDIFEGARLLEGLVRGRSYEDVSPILSRICAICSVAHALTSLKATEDAFGVQVSPQTGLLRDLMFLGESIESHALHLFCLAVPDYLDYPSVIALAADKPGAAALGLRLKKLGNLIQETIGGRAVHPVNAVPGGFGRLPTLDQLITLRQALRQGVADGEITLDLMASLPPAEFCRAETAFAALRSDSDYSYYQGDQIVVLAGGERETVAAAGYRSLTNERTVPHSHAKHSSYRGRPFMVGALARLAVRHEVLDGRAGEALQRLNLRLPSHNPMDNNKAQAVELLGDLARALALVERLLREGLREERCVPVVPRAATGTAATEAPRGLLFHSYSYDGEGRVVSADVITPTALNAASLEAHFRAAVRQNADSQPPLLTKQLEMIARAYDPCVSCSVHVVRKRDAAQT
jgi:sulfhydrogenase subunit alpha